MICNPLIVMLTTATLIPVFSWNLQALTASVIRRHASLSHFACGHLLLGFHRLRHTDPLMLHHFAIKFQRAAARLYMQRQIQEQSNVATALEQNHPTRASQLSSIQRAVLNSLTISVRHIVGRVIVWSCMSSCFPVVNIKV